MRQKQIYRTPIRQKEILSYVREKIWAGEWKPMEQLPPRVWFEKHFHAAVGTVQKAFQILIDQGLIVTNGRNGSSVAANLPHLSRFALVSELGEPGSFMLGQSILKSVEILKKELELDLRFFNVRIATERESWERISPELEALIRERLIAGILMTTPTLLFDSAEFRKQKKIPGFILSDIDLGLNRISADWSGFWKQMVRTAALRNAQNVAVFHPSWLPDPSWEKLFHGYCAEFGLTCRQEHCLELCSLYHPTYAGNIARLMFSADRTEYPDTLLVGDDNFLPHIQSALRERFGEEAPRKIQIISHANFPLTYQTDWPVCFIGMNLLRVILDFVRETVRIIHGKPLRPLAMEYCEEYEFSIQNEINQYKSKGGSE